MFQKLQILELQSYPDSLPVSDINTHLYYSFRIYCESLLGAKLLYEYVSLHFFTIVLYVKEFFFIEGRYI